MLSTLLSMVFRCSHRRTTFPYTPPRRTLSASAPANMRHGTYVVCLDCGKEFDYNWQEMRVGGAVPATATVTPRPSESFSIVNR